MSWIPFKKSHKRSGLDKFRGSFDREVDNIEDNIKRKRDGEDE